jgi:hypothetical protein
MTGEGGGGGEREGGGDCVTKQIERVFIRSVTIWFHRNQMVRLLLGTYWSAFWKPFESLAKEHRLQIEKKFMKHLHYLKPRTTFAQVPLVKSHLILRQPVPHASNVPVNQRITVYVTIRWYFWKLYTFTIADKILVIYIAIIPIN